MGTYSIRLAHNFTGETGFVIIVPRKTTAPLADVVCTIDGVVAQTRKVYPFPHTQQQMLVEGLDPVIYFFKCYRSADGVALDEQINIIALDAKTGASQVLTRYTYVVDRGNSEVDVWADPVAGDHGLNDTRLLDKQYYIEERGTGSFMDEEITQRVGGGFDFTDADKNFEGGVYFAWVANDVTLPDGSSGSGTPTADDIIFLTTNINYDPIAHVGKVLQAAYASAVGVLTIPALATVPDGSFTLDTNGGTQRNVVLQLFVGETAAFLGQGRNKVILGKGESVKVIFKAGVMYLYNYSGDARSRGQRIFADVLLPNTFFLAGTGPHNLIDWPSVQEIINGLNALSIITSLATWNNTITDGGPTFDAITKYPNHGKWCVPGDGTFYFPDARKQFVRGIDFTVAGEVPTYVVDGHRQSQGPGGLQKQALDEHFHPSGTETNPATPGTRRGGTRSVRAWAGGAGVAGANPASTDVNINAQPGDTRPDNHGSLPLIRI